MGRLVKRGGKAPTWPNRGDRWQRGEGDPLFEWDGNNWVIVADELKEKLRIADAQRNYDRAMKGI